MAPASILKAAVQSNNALLLPALVFVRFIQRPEENGNGHQRSIFKTPCTLLQTKAKARISSFKMEQSFLFFFNEDDMSYLLLDFLRSNS